MGDAPPEVGRREHARSVPTVHPPLPMAWVLVLLAAFAILLVGLLATILVFRRLPDTVDPPRLSLWPALALASGLTVLSLFLRTFRWIFLLRRSDTRIPLRDACVAYLSGFSLLLTPLLVGEVAVRAVLQRARGGVPVETTVTVNLWERLLDLAALAGIVGALGTAGGVAGPWAWAWFVLPAVTVFGSVRHGLLAAVRALARLASRRFDRGPRPEAPRLARGRTWLVALATSVFAWLLPGASFWVLSAVWDPPLSFVQAEHAYALSSALGGLQLAPAGVLVTGGHLLDMLEAHGLRPADAALSVMAIRLSTVGVSTILGVLFIVVHFRVAVSGGARHFDAIADAYDVQIPESRRLALLERKTTMMREVLDRLAVGRRGLDVGCGQGAYLARMRRLGFAVRGIDASAGQIERAQRNAGAAGAVVVGSVMGIPARSESHDFAYAINILHHLPSVDQQQQAFAELFRVLRPGGLLFVHEINTRNILFRFYMGYVFPSLNCIDEGVERWLLPGRLRLYTPHEVVDTRYFTFLPDFIPQGLANLLRPLERALERSPLGVYSAHYMAVFRKGVAA